MQYFQCLVKNCLGGYTVDLEKGQLPLPVTSRVQRAFFGRKVVNMAFVSLYMGVGALLMIELNCIPKSIRSVALMSLAVSVPLSVYFTVQDCARRRTCPSLS